MLSTFISIRGDNTRYHLKFGVLTSYTMTPGHKRTDIFREQLLSSLVPVLQSILGAGTRHPKSYNVQRPPFEHLANLWQ